MAEEKPVKATVRDGWPTWVVVLAIVGVALLCAFVMVVWGVVIDDELEAGTAAFGDAFAPAVGFLSSIALGAAVVSVFLQRAELIEQRRELRETRDELRRQREAAERSEQVARVHVQTMLMALQGQAVDLQLRIQNQARSGIAGAAETARTATQRVREQVDDPRLDQIDENVRKQLHLLKTSEARMLALHMQEVTRLLDSSRSLIEQLAATGPAAADADRRKD